MRVNINYAKYRSRMTQIRRELKHLVRNLTDDFYEELTDVYVPQMSSDIEAEVPEDTGALASAITIIPRKLKKGFSVNVTARVNDPRTGYNYAYIQHENLDYEHPKATAKAFFIEDPFMQMIADIAEIELGIEDYEGIGERDL